jgi:polyisoprenyl-phosphate glycosyltransferase
LSNRTTASTPAQATTIGRSQLQPRLALVVPCFDEELILQKTAARLLELLHRLGATHQIDSSSFIYLIDDGSRDATWAIIQALHQEEPSIKGLKLVRNVGTQNALLAGLLSVKDRCDCVVSIDADLQQDPQVIEMFLERYREGCDIVYGVRRKSGEESAAKKATSWFFYHLMQVMGARIVKQHSEFRLMSHKALEAIADYPEHNVFLRGIVADLGYRSEIVLYDARRREEGRSKHGLRKLVSLALEGITSFSVVPLRLVAITGALIFLFSGGMTLFYLYHKLMGNTPPGWAGTIIPIYFLGGVQIMFLGLVGEYIGKIYKEVKARPRFIKDEELF